MKLDIQKVSHLGSLDLEGKVEGEGFLKDAVGHPFLCEPIQVKLHAQAHDGDVYVTGQFKTTVNMSCSRCLKNYTTTFSTGLNLVVPKLEVEADITEEVRQALVLELPSKPLCRKDCKGLCPSCGKNRNEEKCSCVSETEHGSFDALKNIQIH